MAKISQEPDASALTGAEFLVVVQGGATKKTPVSAVAGVASVQVFNVKDYGAVGDGSHDDTSAIQAAVTATVTGGRRGGIVYAPAGTYRITSTVTLPDPHGGFQDAISLWGEGPTLTKFSWAGASSGFVPMFDVLGQAYCSFRRFGLTNGTGAGRAQTIGLWFRGDAHSGGTTGGSAIFEHVSATGLSRGWIIGDTNDAISELLCQQCTFNNCDFGVLAVQQNTLDLTFVLLQLSGNTTGIHFNGAGCGQVYGGSAAGNTLDFRYSPGGAFTLSGFRSETAGKVLLLETGSGVVEGCTLQAPSSVDKIALQSDAGTLAVSGCFMDGKIASRGGNAIVLTGNWIGNGGGTSSTPLVVPISGLDLGGVSLAAFGNRGMPSVNGDFMFPNRLSVFDGSNVEHGMIQNMTTGLITFP
jgi:hypothetical protein